MILGIMGPTGSGKDEAADWLVAHYGLIYHGTTSTAITREVARREHKSFTEAFNERHARKEYWRAVGDEMRKDDPAALAKAMLGSDGNLLVGVRAGIEIAAVREQNLCDLIIWVDRPGIPFDITMGFGPEMCDLVIQNHWGLSVYLRRWNQLAKSLGVKP